MFNQVNIICRDMDATIAFYATLGLDVSPTFPLPGGSGHHAEAAMPNGTTVEFDDHGSADAWAPGWSRPHGVVLGFAVASADEVDETFRRVVDAGYTAIQPPFDAFWRARYAVVEDPDGNAVGIMGPRAAT
jgi:uncharacterized glyoxalase superfamily protein PhnB